MKTAIGSLTLALTLIVTPGAAQSTSAAAEGPRIIPPPEFDHPFAGTVIVIPARDQNHVLELCPGSKFVAGFPALACAHLTPCKIVLAADDVIKEAGHLPDLVRRHEIAHCNGWPADHPGATPYEEWAERAASNFDNFARDAVGKTVAEIAEILAQIDARPYISPEDGRRLAARFVIAARSIGLARESRITGAILSNPVTARVLTKALGVGLSV
jgi:hypothetical protein